MKIMMFLLTLTIFVFSSKSVSSRKCVEETLYCGDPVSGIFKIGNSSCCDNSEYAGALKFLSSKLYVCLGNKWATFEFEKLFDYGTEFNSGYSCKDIKDKTGKQLSDGIYWIRLRGGQDVFPVYCDMAGGGWTMVFKVVSNTSDGLNPIDAYDSRLPIAEFVFAALANTSKHKSHYKNRVATEWAWGSFNPSETRVALFHGGNLLKELVFQASGKGRYSWFSAAALLSSSWSDLKTETTNLFSIKGDCDNLRAVQSRTGCRSFVINRSGGGCLDADGWIMLPHGPWCEWQKTSFPIKHIIYSKGDTYTKWSKESEVGVAEVLAVFVR